MILVDICSVYGNLKSSLIKKLSFEYIKKSGYTKNIQATTESVVRKEISMNNFSTSGNFGKVKMGPSYLKSSRFSALDHIDHCGWHKVNDLYRIDRPQGTTDYLLIFTKAGKGKICQNGRNYNAAADTLSIVTPGIQSCYYTPKQCSWEFYWLHVSGVNAETMISNIMAVSGQNMKLKIDAVEKYLSIIINSNYKGLESELIAANMVSKILFTIMYSINEDIMSKDSEDIACKLMENIEENYNKPFSLEKVSKQYFISKEHLIRLFKKKTGTTPYDYYQHFRIVRSAHALAYSNMSIAEVAESVGYSNETSYSVQFKKEMKVSPSEYRKTFQSYKN